MASGQCNCWHNLSFHNAYVLQGDPSHSCAQHSLGTAAVAGLQVVVESLKDSCGMYFVDNHSHVARVDPKVDLQLMVHFASWLDLLQCLKKKTLFSFKMNKLGLDFVLRLIFTSHFVTVT